MAPSIDDIVVKERHTPKDYLIMLKGLLPKGRFWDVDISALILNWADNSGSVFSRLLATFAQELYLLENYALKTYEYVNPITSENFPRWNTLSGNVLQYHANPALTDAQKREIVWDHIFGEQIYITDDYLVEQGANMGWTIVVSTDVFEYYGFELGVDSSNDGLNQLGVDSGNTGLNQLGVWNRYALVEIDGTATEAWAVSGEAMVARMLQIKPAHVILIFAGELSPYAIDLTGLYGEDASGVRAVTGP
jgi:hypothetical protein